MSVLDEFAHYWHTKLNIEKDISTLFIGETSFEYLNVIYELIEH